jgi:hypothetical protein
MPYASTVIASSPVYTSEVYCQAGRALNWEVWTSAASTAIGTVTLERKTLNTEEWQDVASWAITVTDSLSAAQTMQQTQIQAESAQFRAGTKTGDWTADNIYTRIGTT